MGFYTMCAIIFTGIVIWGMYDTKKKSKVRIEEIRLEREKVILEQKKLDKKQEA
ncbi:MULTISPECIES: hypothetical protein [Bacillaceae]|uniref:Uncharacterized protein n=1 Tax=Evansella alkalicola TaxID=745819 RepID=A0ABS6JMQ6_9BACI|nr:MULTISPECIES: hypothetical protein [Bacillaceae]MBU9719843.1 hypothetical protein [Bacillus alkalicola]